MKTYKIFDQSQSEKMGSISVISSVIEVGFEMQCNFQSNISVRDMTKVFCVARSNLIICY